MVPVLVLCIAVFVVNVGCHLLAIVGAFHEFSLSSFRALLGVVIASGVASISTHPKSKYQGGEATLALSSCLKVLPPAARTAYIALLVYSLVAVVVAAVSLGRSEVSFDELRREPYLFTAFLLVFSTCGVCTSHSAVLLYNHPFGFDEPE